LARVIVVGGGISGLAAAYFAQKAGHTVTLIERERRLGGLIHTEYPDGCTVEAGPDSFLAAKPAARQLIEELGLGGEIVASNDHARKTYLLREGRLVPMPEGMTLMAPVDFEALERSELVSDAGKRRAKEELDYPAGERPERSVGEFVRDHWGEEFVETFAEPLLTGVFGGDIETLSVDCALPRLVELERRYGSVSRGLAAEKKENGGPLFLSLKRGMGSLIEALEGRFKGNRVTGEVEAVEPGWRVRVGRDWIEGDRVIVALRAWQAAPLVAPFDSRLAGELAAIEYSSAVTVGFAEPAESVPHPRDGFGFLVPRRERKAMSACTWSDRKFPFRAPPTHANVRAFLGGEIWCSAPTEEILRAVQEELRETMGIAMRSTPAIYRWARSMPQYNLGHAARVERIEIAVAEHAGLSLAGNYFDGVGIPDAIRRAQSVTIKSR
jgi:oxygen-dependent protoporphyrinogen oxidase